MGINLRNGGGSGGGSSLSVPNDFIFASVAERDSFFSASPSRLVDGIYVSTNGTLQQYSSGSWTDLSAVIQGQSGNDAPPITIQYSETGNSGWTETYNSATHSYWRWSTDGGTTWSADNVKFKATDGGSGVPAPFEYSLNGDKLVLTKNGTKQVASFDERECSVPNGFRTGVGSLHIGDLHSNGSAGENVVWVNEDSNIAWYPAWAGVSRSTGVETEMSARKHSDTVLSVEPVGTAAGGDNFLPYFESTFTSVADAAFFYLQIFSGEDYNGELELVVIKSTGKEVCRFCIDVNISKNDPVTFNFEYPLWMSTGQEFKSSIFKSDGTPLSVRANTTLDAPYRLAAYKTYVDHKVFHEGNPDLVASSMSNLTGDDRLDFGAIKSIPTASSSDLGMVKIGSTITINGDGEIDTAVSPTSIKIVADETARLAIAQSGGAQLAIQQDNSFTYGIEAGLDPSVNSNWKQIGSTATNVVSFNSRNGAVTPKKGDYKSSQVLVKHDDTSVNGFFGIDNNGIYWDNSYDSLNDEGETS